MMSPSAIIGKYVDLTESYKSLHEAIGAWRSLPMMPRLICVMSVLRSLKKAVQPDYWQVVKVSWCLVAFGKRGVEGKIMAVNYARTNKIPFFGICLGMQLAVVEFARNIAGMKGAHSTEFDSKTPYPVMYLMKEWYDYRSQEGAGQG